jgi:pimeloyl-ACP methyl ester carboxylesterase
VVIVGHSYGGMVITGVVDRVPERIRHVIYLDAFVPEDGESANTSRGSGAPFREAVDGFFPPGRAAASKPIPHDVPHPAKTFSEPIALKNQEAVKKLPTTYILTVDPGQQPEQDGFFRFYERARARGWKTLVMEGDHNVQWSRPKELVALLEQAP